MLSSHTMYNHMLIIRVSRLTVILCCMRHQELAAYYTTSLTLIYMQCIHFIYVIGILAVDSKASSECVYTWYLTASVCDST